MHRMMQNQSGGGEMLGGDGCVRSLRMCVWGGRCIIMFFKQINYDNEEKVLVYISISAILISEQKHEMFKNSNIGKSNQTQCIE